MFVKQRARTFPHHFDYHHLSLPSPAIIVI